MKIDKSFYKKKTFWIGIAGVVASIIPEAQEFLDSNPEALSTAIAFITSMFGYSAITKK